MVMRQDPDETRVFSKVKEPGAKRRPVDPPPMVQLFVSPYADPAQHYLQNPYLFMAATLWKADKDEAWDGSPNESLAGTLVSSLHRLKDTDNKEGGFFVFPDISVKIEGTFRLHFTLFDTHKHDRTVAFLGSVTSKPFRVVSPKEHKGMMESTYLSRSFCDQGVRIRLRKQNQTLGKRMHASVLNDSMSQDMERDYFLDEREPASKRSCSEQGNRRGLSSASPNQLQNGSVPASPHEFRPNFGNGSNLPLGALLHTSAAYQMSPQAHYANMQTYPPYVQHTPPPPPISYSDNPSMLSIRSISSQAFPDQLRHPNAGNIPSSMSLSQQTAQYGHMPQQANELISRHNDAFFTSVPEISRSGYPHRPQLEGAGAQLPVSGQSVSQYEHIQGTSGPFRNTVSHLQTLPTGPTMTNYPNHGVANPTAQFVDHSGP
ncbi:hypothetical protein GQ43DRAFT_469507 [Delitschia confertaspora ATCC 74209]|uniref:Velvet domain-containing protein n=1 Tax=Delitschia confertaspora ATCC 74209 TaxID=1513339 RepID=A0A9P4JQR8_9PLEO|nr:hypothetical protein GQ43DRAFT_469507 [Delitschia confertaspora ATCC 74209]